MKKVILLRHIQSLLNAGETDEHDCDVTKKGALQADALPMAMKTLLGSDWHKESWRGFVSPFLRTLKTAAPIHKHFDIPFIVDYRVAECPDDSYMKLKISTINHRKEEFPQYNWNDFPEGGILPKERRLDAYKAGILDFVRSLPSHSIIVTHMSPVKDLAFLLTQDNTAFTTFVGNASITLIEGNNLVHMAR